MDPLRPQLSFANLLHQRIDRDFGVASTAASSSAPASTDALVFNQADAMRQLNALGSLLENRYKKMVLFPLGGVERNMVVIQRQYPVTERTMRPLGQPDYYEKLLKELDIAPKRTWLQRQLNSWKGWIRMK